MMGKKLAVRQTRATIQTSLTSYEIKSHQNTLMATPNR